MSGHMKRYHHPQISDHLAANYVMGTLTDRVRSRVQTLLAQGHYSALSQRVVYWEQKMSPLDEQTPELAPQAGTFEAIEARIHPHRPTQAKTGWRQFFGLRFYQYAAACSVLLVALLSFQWTQRPADLGPLSYVAVMTDTEYGSEVVAATYGESKQLMLDLIALPDTDDAQSLELWVKSKTDAQIRSLGLLPTGETQFVRTLSEAEWRLIKDSDSLLISIEDAGGSPIGEPMGDIVSAGKCIRLSAWSV